MPAANTTLTQLVADITNGHYDRDFDIIKGCIDSRKKALVSIRTASIRPGDRVRIVDTRPKYLIGQLATVERVNQTTVTAKLDRTVGKFRMEHNIRIPVACVEIV